MVRHFIPCCSLLLQAYNLKVIDSDALVRHQYAQGKGCVNLCVIFKGQRYLVAIKLEVQNSLANSLNQLAGELHSCGEKEGWLVIFDKNINTSFDNMIS
ncbi:MAG: hypothetical protein LBD41_05035 [Clostridiales Family XIII bacterium]|jgi:hypothetical protein|nr:hypothetical protein [Clostridiales Family XIII bacterium]